MGTLWCGLYQGTFFSQFFKFWWNKIFFSFLAVEELRRGATPTEAAQTAIKRIAQKYPDFFGAILVSTNKGEFGAACNGMVSFPFAVASADLGGVVLENVTCNL